MNTPNTHTTQKGEFSARVAQHDTFGYDIFSIHIELVGPAFATFKQAKPGQFVQLACRDISNYHCPTPLLRRPFSIAGVNIISEESLLIEVIYHVVGPGTKWLQDQKVGNKINLIGPLGNNFKLPENQDSQIFLIGGGVGLPPMFFLADQLVNYGHNQIIAIAGARSSKYLENAIENHLIPIQNPLEANLYLKQFSRSNTKCIIATDDGSLGFHGNVVQALDAYLSKNPCNNQAQIFCCGPHGMLKSIALFAQSRHIECQVCMEAYMACGIGLCQSCAVPVQTSSNTDEWQYKLVCTNGPVFNSKMILWDKIEI
ncbi:MAG: dihydroorotate dehydrogenase electron transfer subunit [Sedimentisphaerales bacterium]|nr:dihydroorotate dehydrogenase electron transfer subunit [Sedimentisphaerales bacterium]